MLVKFLKLVVNTFFQNVTIKGINNLPDSGPVIFTPNHPNALIDPLLMFFLPPVYKIHFVAKAPLFKIPLFGWILRKMHAIPVVRRFEAKGKVDYKLFFDACIDSLAAGNSITIFPEGVSLSQPYMADVRTGTARLFFMARNRNIDVKIVPVGLNYEHGSIFRTSVVIWAAKTLETSDLIAMYQEFPQSAVRNLTKRIKDSLDEHVFQTESYRDRELILLLEQIYGEENNNGTWSVRLERLKQFEMGLIFFKDQCADEIVSLRRMLSRYESLTKSLEGLHRTKAGNQPGSPMRFFLVLLGLPFAGLGWLLNVLPYQLINLIVKHMKKYEESAAATYKVLYALLLFPLTYVLETGLIYLWLGWVVAIIFAIFVVPLSYFTLFFQEWVQKGGWVIPVVSMRLKRTLSPRILTQIKDQRARITSLVDNLAKRLDKQPE
jgi:glycerol-3-phosphate O-acyltransferase / dihydroxyacetone phosphate acyltransferase